MEGAMEWPMRINLFIGVGSAFWPLHCWVLVGSHFILPCAEGNTYYEARSGLRAMGPWVVSYAVKNDQVCINHQATVYLAYGG
jgi:hypothetical protein